MYFIVDLEATCWEIPKVPDLNEIIDIGVVLCNYRYDVVSTWSSLVRPKVNQKLSSYCKKLTKISQESVDTAEPLSLVISNLKLWLTTHHNKCSQTIPWYTWGSWDHKCLTADCFRNGIDFPFGEHRDLKPIYASMRNNGSSNGCNLKDVLQKEGLLTPTDRFHRGIGDALATAKIARLIYPNQQCLEDHYF